MKIPGHGTGGGVVRVGTGKSTLDKLSVGHADQHEIL